MTPTLLNSTNAPSHAGFRPRRGEFATTQGFYKKFGFEVVDPDAVCSKERPFRTMFFDLKPIFDALQAS